MTWRPIVSYILRGCQSVFAIIILGLTSGILAKLGHNESRVTYSLVVAIMNIIYFGYSLALVPSIKRNRTISSLIFICEALFTIFYLAAMGAIADVFPSGDCDSFFFSNDLASACKMYKALLPFNLFNWLLFTATLTLFIGFSYIPQIRSYGFANTFTLTRFEFGVIFANTFNLFGKPVAGVKSEGEPVDGAVGAGAGAGAGTGAEGEAAPVAPAPADAEANVGIASTDEDQEKGRSPSGSNERLSNGEDLAANERPYP